MSKYFFIPLLLAAACGTEADALDAAEAQPYAPAKSGLTGTWLLNSYEYTGGCSATGLATPFAGDVVTVDASKARIILESADNPTIELEHDGQRYSCEDEVVYGDCVAQVTSNLLVHGMVPHRFSATLRRSVTITAECEELGLQPCSSIYVVKGVRR